MINGADSFDLDFFAPSNDIWKREDWEKYIPMIYLKLIKDFNKIKDKTNDVFGVTYIYFFLYSFVWVFSILDMASNKGMTSSNTKDNGNRKWNVWGIQDEISKGHNS